jgi:hypothetical protein
LNCDSKNTEVKNQTVETVKKEIIQKQEVVQKSDSSDCECPNPFETAETRIKIDYGNDKYLKFCSWDYHLTDSITAEFRIYDQSDSMLLQGDIPTEFTIMSLTKPVNLIQSTIMDTGHGKRWKMTPIFEYQIELTNNQFEVSQGFVFQPPSMTQMKMDSVMKVFNEQPKHHNKYDKFDPPFTSEQYVMDLFICAVNGNEECIQATDSLRTRFVTDGAISELYYNLKGLLQIYKKEKTTSANNGEHS